MSKNLQLVVFSGAHEGAELPLDPGEYTLGSGDECDIILSDEGIAATHAMVSINGDQIWLRPMAQPITVEGQPLAEDVEQTRLEPFQTVGLGSIVVGFGIQGEAWPKLTALVTVASDPKATAQASILGSVQASLEEGDQSKGLFAQVVSSIKGTDGETRTPFYRNPTVVYPAVGGGLLLTGVLLIVLQLQGLGGDSAPNTADNGQPNLQLPPPLTAEQLQQDLASENFAHVEVQAEEGRPLRLTGYVKDAERLQALRILIQPHGLRVSEAVLVHEELVATARRIASHLNFADLQVSGELPAQLSIAGYIPNPDGLERLVATLRQDLPGIQAIDHEGVATLPQRRDELRTLLKEEDLLGKLRVSINNDKLLVEGELSPFEGNQWRQVAQTFLSRHSLPKLESKVRRIAPLELDIRSVSVGVPPYIIMQNGSKYLEGAALPNGYTIKKIQHDRILLAKHDRETIYKLGNDGS
ncbi:MAG: type III secretion system inner membrane ring subunit SctD [Candidatus Competibacterales bacterium]